MNRKLSKLFITTLTILVVTLIATYLRSKIGVYFKTASPYKSVFIGMALMVLIYYPMTTVLNKYFLMISKKVVSKSKNLSKSSTMGMLIGFAIAIFVLFIFYADLWYGIDVIKDIQNAIGL